MSALLRQPPAVVIRLELEKRPAVVFQAFTEGDQERLTDWVTANEPLLDLVSRALALSSEARAA